MYEGQTDHVMHCELICEAGLWIRGAATSTMAISVHVIHDSTSDQACTRRRRPSINTTLDHRHVSLLHSQASHINLLPLRLLSHTPLRLLIYSSFPLHPCSPRSHSLRCRVNPSPTAHLSRHVHLQRQCTGRDHSYTDSKRKVCRGLLHRQSQPAHATGQKADHSHLYGRTARDRTIVGVGGRGCARYSQCWWACARRVAITHYQPAAVGHAGGSHHPPHGTTTAPHNHTRSLSASSPSLHHHLIEQAHYAARHIELQQTDSSPRRLH